MPLTSMLVVCDLDAGCYTRDGTLQPKGMAFDRVSVASRADYAPPLGCVLIADDGQALYVQNSGGATGPPFVNVLEPRVLALENMIASIFNTGDSNGGT